MGNYARLRHLWLKSEIVESTKLWIKAKPNSNGFLPPFEWKHDRLLKKVEEIIVAATPDETDPAKSTYAKEVPTWWRYEGLVATQYWRAPIQKELMVRVNGRKTYWKHSADIPGGVAYENFELEVPFSAGQEFYFGVITDQPEKLGFDKECRKNITDGR